MQEVTVTETGIKDGFRIFEVVVARGLPEQRRGFAAAKMREYARKHRLGSVVLVSQTDGPKLSRFFYSVENSHGDRFYPIPLSQPELDVLIWVCNRELHALQENPERETEVRARVLGDLLRKFHDASAKVISNQIPSH
jgi:hypothetical protein